MSLLGNPIVQVAVPSTREKEALRATPRKQLVSGSEGLEVSSTVCEDSDQISPLLRELVLLTAANLVATRESSPALLIEFPQELHAGPQ